MSKNSTDSLISQPGVIFESGDGGTTVYARIPGSPERRVVYQRPTEPYYISGLELMEIIRMAKNNIALRDLLEKLKVIYDLSKEK